MPAPPLKKAEEQVRVRVEREKRIRGKVGREKAKKLSKKYNKQSCYLLLIYEPQAETPIDAIPVRTQPTLEAVLKDLEELGLYPLIHPQRVYVPQPFWEEYRFAQDSSQRLELVRKYGLLKDSSIYRFDTVVIDIDSPFESVYPVWNELRERLALKSGYQVYKTKSGRFRAYIYLLDGTKDLKRAQELQTVIYAFFEKRGFKADRTFVHRLNHPVFYEEFSLYSYELIEEREGRVSFFWLYRSVKRFQKEEKLYTLGNINLTQHFWNKRPSTKQQSQRKKGKIIKAPAFCRRLQMEKLDVERLWEKAVITLARKHSSYRYIHVIQPAIGWAKYLELDKDYVTEFLVSLLGEEKRRDIEIGWKYVRELEFTVPEKITWWGKTREEWEREVESFIKSRGGEATRQELLKGVFSGQVWLLELILMGMEEAGKIESYFVKAGRGRPRKVYKLVAEVQQGVEAVAVGAEDFSQNNNSLLRAMGGRLEGRGISGNVGNIGKSGQESVKLYGKSKSGSFEGSVKGKEERRGRERVPDLTVVVRDEVHQAELKDQQEGERIELPLELRKLVQESERAQKERDLQRLAELFRGACWYEVELPKLMELYFSNRELGRFVERVLMLSGRRVTDMARRTFAVPLLPCQVQFLSEFLELKRVK